MSSPSGEYFSLSKAVPPAYDEVFSHFYLAVNDSREVVYRTLVPSFQTMLIFSFGTAPVIEINDSEPLVVENCLVLGPVRQSFDYTLPPGSDILVINFREDAFFRFFGQVMPAGAGPVDPDSLFEENCFTDLWRKLKQLPDTNERIEEILRFSAPYIRDRALVPSLIIEASGALTDPIKTVAAETGQSQRNIQLQFKKTFGYSSKELNRYQRFLKAVELIPSIVSKKGKTDWFELIEQCGYYDQSHMIADFQHFMGLTPTKFLALQEQVCQVSPP